ncbi:MAG: hypothetical protein D6719_04475 [Candidatus Dadabacteria bacterium]|nr:MAG: hypothetical protein D6719_04475 [Candidatus Dadabacteria bacterium]
MVVIKKLSRLPLAVLVLLLFTFTDNVKAENSAPAKARLNTSNTASLSRLNYAPIRLDGGTRLTLISPAKMAAVARRVKRTLEKTHAFFTSTFGPIPALKNSVRLMDEETFFLATGAPRWTNAMYYRGQILIPLSQQDYRSLDNVERSLRHEYTHAVINALSNGRCPGWLDEGLAQWAEGSENPALQPALYNWLRDHPPVPLKLLQGGFTRLDPRMVPAAYAQSLFAARTIINTYGLKHIRRYFDRLRNGEPKDVAFKKNFSLTESDFEKRLALSLAKWRRRKTMYHLRMD